MFLERIGLAGIGLCAVLKMATCSVLCGVAFKHIAKHCIYAMDRYGPYAGQWGNEKLYVKDITYSVEWWVTCVSFIGFMVGTLNTYRKHAIIDTGLPNLFLKEKIVQLFPRS